ncbi:uncharacterized protein TNCV_1735381 [Trichonephila clavipes]|nr:uncharacterized protein TNCV_1735381 [Trichonephila clavipes]
MLDVTKYPPSAHGFTCRNCGGGDRGRVAIYRPFGEVSLSLNRTVTCMVLKANDRRTSCPCHDEFRGPRSDYVRQHYTIEKEAIKIYVCSYGVEINAENKAKNIGARFSRTKSVTAAVTIKARAQKDLYNRVSHKSTKNAIPNMSNGPKRRAIAQFYLGTGHDCQRNRLYRLKIVLFQMYALCAALERSWTPHIPH